MNCNQEENINNIVSTYNEFILATSGQKISVFNMPEFEKLNLKILEFEKKQKEIYKDFDNLSIELSKCNYLVPLKLRIDKYSEILNEIISINSVDLKKKKIDKIMLKIFFRNK